MGIKSESKTYIIFQYFQDKICYFVNIFSNRLTLVVSKQRLFIVANMCIGMLNCIHANCTEYNRCISTARICLKFITISSKPCMSLCTSGVMWCFSQRVADLNYILKISFDFLLTLNCYHLYLITHGCCLIAADVRV